MIDIRVAIDKLGGMEVEEIYDCFREEGIKGCVMVATHCPVARWLNKTTGQCWHVTENFVRSLEEGSSLKPEIVIEMPPSVAKFVNRFDALMMTDLIDSDLTKAWEALNFVDPDGME